jgi:hypothetical protein
VCAPLCENPFCSAGFHDPLGVLYDVKTISATTEHYAPNKVLAYAEAEFKRGNAPVDGICEQTVPQQGAQARPDIHLGPQG